MLDPLKQLVGSVQAKDKARRRNHTVPSNIPTSALEAAVEPQRRLAASVKDAAQQLGDSFETIRMLQRGIMRSLQEYLGFDLEGVDESMLALVQACSGFFESCDEALGRTSVHQVCISCDRVLQECDHVMVRVQQRDNTYKEWQHYETKVAQILEAEERFHELDREKLKRNREKLTHAKKVADDHCSSCEDALRQFVERRTVHVRATLRPLLHAYTGTVAGLCRGADSVADAFSSEFVAGASVEVIGLQRQPGLNGAVAILQGIEASGRYTVTLPDGTQKAVRAENLIPMDSPSKEAGSATDSASLPEKRQATVTITPSSGPCAGCEAEVNVDGLEAPISDVLVGAEPTEILEATGSRLRIRVPPSSARGPLSVEVRTAGWHLHTASVDAAFSYYEPIGFGTCGHNVSLSAGPSIPAGVPPAIATRTSGLVHGVALTASPLPLLLGPLASSPGPAGPRGPGAECLGPMLRYYLEAVVLGVLEQRTSRAPAIGFAWPLRPAGEASRETWAAGGVPENAASLPRSFVAGGDLPRAHLGGKELGKLSGWRPLLDVRAGTVLGALLELDAGMGRLSVFQDSICRCVTEGAVPDSWSGAPHGVIDVCGNVCSVQLRQGAMPPVDTPPVVSGQATT
mmetsp:Transcript_71263/g.202020  ORF Transcript_71263/g.202020 Transcript_71263/m.202020 type:complete len:630 (-) Transcript_71263:15-1904(-)